MLLALQKSVYFLLRQQRMVLNLVDCRHDIGILQNNVEVMDLKNRSTPIARTNPSLYSFCRAFHVSLHFPLTGQ